MRRRYPGRQPRRSPSIPITRVEPSTDICLELQDHSILERSAVGFFRVHSRDPHPIATRLAEQFEAQNRMLLDVMGVRVERFFNGNDVVLRIESGSVVGAVPLVSPTRGTPDYGLVVQPRFAWKGIGSMLVDMGWRIVPSPLKLPLLKRSERRVPPWVLSTMVLVRLRALLEALTRRFELVEDEKSAPRGTVHWSDYATRHMSRGNFLSVPCTFPDLRDDRLLKGAVRYTLEKQLQSLESQREHGAFIHRIIEICQELLQRVRDVQAYLPSSSILTLWLQRPLRQEHLVNGLQAIQWTIEDRGLAGVSDLEGIPWKMEMDQFFEAWVETIFQAVARHHGAEFLVGRKRQTVHAINWDPVYVGSQKSLVPDIWLQWESITVIVDAKYKRHWEELEYQPWRSADELLREQHRSDLLQVLAYATLASTKYIVGCLVYPCSLQTWNSLRERRRFIHKAVINVGARALHLWLAAIPMAVSSDQIAPLFSRELYELRRDEYGAQEASYGRH